MGDRLVVLATSNGRRRIEQGIGSITPKGWRVQVEKAWTDEAVFEGANAIARISGCNLNLARDLMKNLPGILRSPLYKHQAQRLVREEFGIPESFEVVAMAQVIIEDDDVAVCSIVKAELFYGAMRSNNPERSLAMQQEFLNRFVSLPFDDEASLIYDRIRAQLATLGTPIGSYDFQIAAIALANNLILVTHNTREFSRVEGLRLEDWELSA